MNNLMSKRLNEKISGALYGLAIGDALGVGAEFMSREEVSYRYPNGLRDYDDIYQDAHRSQWKPGEWTNDTEVTLRMIESVLETGKLDVGCVARKFKEWYKENPKDMVSNLRQILNHPDYEDSPEDVARAVWLDMGGTDASNEANSRSPFVGWAKENHREAGARICAITHADPRCIASNVALAEMGHDLFWNDRVTDAQTLIDIVSDIDDRVVPYIRMAQNDTLEELDLDDSETYWYTRKTMAAALWAVWKDLTPMEAFDAIFREGGDVDTNACLALSLLGMKSGPDAFPENLRESLVEKKRLDRLADALTEYFINLGYEER